MTAMQLTLIITVFTYLVPLGIFIGLYARSPWTSTELGITLMMQKIIFVVIVMLLILSLWLGDYPARQWLWLAAFIIVDVLLWVDVVNLRRYRAVKKSNRRWVRKK